MKKTIILCLLFIFSFFIIPLSGCKDNTSTITFNTGFSDIKINSITEKIGKNIQEPEKPTKEGFKFISWLKDGEKYEFKTMPNEDIELIAYWLDLSYSEGNLPCMTINLFDKNGDEYSLDLINREDYIDSKISILNTEEQYQLEEVSAGFRGRGNGSWYGAGGKNGYKIKFTNKQSLFGREKNKHWVIIACANFQDSTMYRNYLAYNMAGAVFSNIEYTTNAKWIDVYINGKYNGVYLLCEHVRVDNKRVEIESEYGVEDTGYLIEYDAYATGREEDNYEEGIHYFRIEGVKYPFTVKSPDPQEYLEEISKEEYIKQVNYIKNYIQNVYNAALNHDFETFSSLVDVDSFVDMYLIHELFKNADTGWSSFFMYKKPNGELFAGPVWDFDGTTNIVGRGDRTPQGIYVAQGVMNGSAASANELFIELYKTEGFLTAVKNRWNDISNDIEIFIDEMMNENIYETYKSDIAKNFVLWKNKVQLNAETDWVNDCKILKQWMLDRIEWLNQEWEID